MSAVRKRLLMSVAPCFETAQTVSCTVNAVLINNYEKTRFNKSTTSLDPQQKMYQNTDTK